MFGTSILVMLFIPARFIRTVFPTFLPYTTQSQVITHKHLSEGRLGNHQAIAIISISTYVKVAVNLKQLAILEEISQ